MNALKNIIVVAMVCCFGLALGMDQGGHIVIPDLRSRECSIDSFNQIKKQMIVYGCGTVVESGKIATRLSCVSKKMYEQVNCIMFVTDIITRLAGIHQKTREEIAHTLGTPGARRYHMMGKKLTTLVKDRAILYDGISTWTEHNKNAHARCKKAINDCISRGGDIQFDTWVDGTSLLEKAIFYNDNEGVKSLMQKGFGLYTDSYKACIRERFLEWNKQVLSGMMLTLLHHIEEQKKVQEQTPEKYDQWALYRFISGSPIARYIRNACAIERLLLPDNSWNGQELYRLCYTILVEQDYTNLEANIIIATIRGNIVFI